MPALYAKRAVVTKKLKPVPVECIARGYIIGSGWKDYQRTGAISGIALPAGLQQAQQLAEPIFTPSTKAAVGDHDENIDFATAVRPGRRASRPKRCATPRSRSMPFAARLRRAARHPAGRHQVRVRHRRGRHAVRDGRDADAGFQSRYWPADEYAVGTSPPSYDKQFVRDYLETLDWNKTAPGPKLPAEVIERTRAKYAEALQKLAGISID